MKTIAVAFAVAGSASAFAPSFMGQKLVAPSTTTSSSTPTMLLNFGSKKPAQKASPPGTKPPSPSQVKGAVKKAPQQLKQAASTAASKAKQATSTVKRSAIATGSGIGGGKVSKRPASSPGFAGGLVGSDVEAPFFDPWELSVERSPESLAWFRTAELKHGRICMLAALGLLVQSVYHLPDDVFNNPKGIDALYQVSSERPQAIAQILLAIGAVEVASLLQQNREPGDLGFDPLNLKPKTAELVNELQLKEIKNGRLAMVGVAGMLVQETLTKQGVLEQLNSGHVSPFGDGQGFF